VKLDLESATTCWCRRNSDSRICKYQFQLRCTTDWKATIRKGETSTDSGWLWLTKGLL